jgi:transposase-like protein
MRGERSPNWKGGRENRKDGYVMVHAPGHPKAHKGKVLEHRLVIEKKVERYLTRNEKVHHLNHDTFDNRKENLVLMSQSKHQDIHAYERSLRNNLVCPRCESKRIRKDGRMKDGRQIFQCSDCGKYILLVKKYSGWSGRKRFQICRRCGSFDTVKDGYLQGKQQFKCDTCRRYFTAYGKLIMNHNQKCPKCGCNSTQKRGIQNEKQRYSCNGCKQGFSIPLGFTAGLRK